MARRRNELRPVRIKTGFIDSADGSALIEMGRTRVLCNASTVESVPPWRAGSGRGWVTAEYAMLPASVPQRKPRSPHDSRGIEIQRIVGRALRGVVDMATLGERTITIDCDVLQGDGGTRAASITGGYVALALAVRKLMRRGTLDGDPLQGPLGAVSVGIVDGKPRLDLDYELDSRAEVDLTVVMTDKGRLVEIQGTAERGSFDRTDLDRMLDIAARGIRKLIRIQREALGTARPKSTPTRKGKR